MKNTNNVSIEEQLDRLKTAIAYLKGKQIITTQIHLSQEMGINKSSLSTALKGDDRYLTTSFLNKFSETFHFNANWLIEGTGEMINNVHNNLNQNNQPSNLKSKGEDIGSYTRNGNVFIEQSSGTYRLKTKLVMHKAQAGYITGWGDDEFLEDLPEHEISVNKPVAGQYMSFEVLGDSMDDGTKESIEDGSIVTGRKIARKYWSTKLHLNKYKDFVIVCNNCANGEGGILLKRILEHNTDEHYIICHSLNPDKTKYPDFRINMIDIMQIFNVVQTARIH